jgi:hypothetical protein
MFRLSAVFAVLLLASQVRADAPPISSVVTAEHGAVQGNLYVSPTGAFTVPLPVLPALGGAISDNSNVVTFKDDFSTLITIGAFPLDATERWELATRGNRDYLIYFFGTVIAPEFRREFPTMSVEGGVGKYLANLAGGSLLTYVLLPGGSAFADKADPFTVSKGPPVAKRANVIFVKNGFTFVISTELAEHVTEGAAYKKTVEEENQILRTRIEALIASMVFPKSAAAPAAASGH